MEKEITEILLKYKDITDITWMLDCLELASRNKDFNYDFRFTSWPIPGMHAYKENSRYGINVACYTGKKVEDMLRFLLIVRPIYCFLCCKDVKFPALKKVLKKRNYELFEADKSIPPYFYHHFDKETKTKVNIIVL